MRAATRGDCPVCGYPNAYTETIGKRGKRIGWCASCQDRDAIGAFLRGEAGPEQRAGEECATAYTKDTLEARQKAQEQARVIWGGAAPVTAEDAAGRYLARRALASLIPSPAMRYRQDVSHPSGGRYPAMVALVQDAAGALLGVHRTYLTPNGNKARLEPVKASKGLIWGGAIRLAAAAREIVIGEGIETAASAGVLLGMPSWAAISAGNLATGLVLPAEVRSVVIAADDDGMNALGHNPGIEAAEAAARRWQGESRKVQIVKPTTPGQDFNDVLLSRRASGGLRNE